MNLKTLGLSLIILAGYCLLPYEMRHTIGGFAFGWMAYDLAKILTSGIKDDA